MSSITLPSTRFVHEADGTWSAKVALRGNAVLRDPLLNRGTAFTPQQRVALHLEGRLPPHDTSMENQVDRVLENVRRKTDPLEKYIGLAALQDRNEVLFYHVLVQHAEELLPIVYTPTVGEACQLYSRIFRRARGVWITPDMRGRIADVLRDLERDSVRLIVVTDNERILGLGDQGAGGIGIPIGKLALYVAGAGIHPTWTLPVSLDVGTDNQDLLDDPLYLGWREKRLRGPEYDTLVEEFVAAVKKIFPDALLQWEDFKKGNAFALLERYRQALPSFNDDIEGTAAVALAGVLAACRVTGVPIAQQRVVIAGAGAAGIGIGRQVRSALQRAGVAGDALGTAVAIIDSRGLLVRGGHSTDAYKQEFAWDPQWARQFDLPDGADLHTVVERLQPTVLIGTTGTPDMFDKRLIETMSRAVERPIVLPFSNPTSKSEAKPVDILAWSEGRALVATGSPFDPVQVGDHLVRIGQGNNVFIFPGVGLGALVAEVDHLTDSMFTVAAEVLADIVSEEDLAEGALYPHLSQLRPISRAIALAVAREAVACGASSRAADTDWERLVDHAMWKPDYPRLEVVQG
jgi:malic enzyme